MSADKEHIGRLIEAVRDAGVAYQADEPDAKARLCHHASVLLREAQGPATFIPWTRLSALTNICQLMALEMGVIQAIVDAGPTPIAASALAQNLNYDEHLIARIMRVLTGNGICEETGVREYRKNANADFLTLPSQQGATRNMVELLFPIAGGIRQQVVDLREAAPARAAELASPFKYIYGRSMFDFFATNAHHKAAFDAWMAGRRRGQPWFNTYPFEERLLPNALAAPEDVAVVDVAGGQGHDICALAQRYAGKPMRLVLQDLPETLARLEGAEMHGVELMAHDIMTPQPVRGAGAYFLRAVLHDWPDEDALKILTHTAAAMVPGRSRLLIEDMILPDIGASAWDAAVDMTMYMMPGGVERTEGEWRSLLTAAGLRIVGIWRAGASAEPVLEAELVESKGTASRSAL